MFAWTSLTADDDRACNSSIAVCSRLFMQYTSIRATENLQNHYQISKILFCRLRRKLWLIVGAHLFLSCQTLHFHSRHSKFTSISRSDHLTQQTEHTQHAAVVVFFPVVFPKILAFLCILAKKDKLHHFQCLYCREEHIVWKTNWPSIVLNIDSFFGYSLQTKYVNAHSEMN